MSCMWTMAKALNLPKVPIYIVFSHFQAASSPPLTYHLLPPAKPGFLQNALLKGLYCLDALPIRKLLSLNLQIKRLKLNWAHFLLNQGKAQLFLLSANLISQLQVIGPSKFCNFYSCDVWCIRYLVSVGRFLSTKRRDLFLILVLNAKITLQSKLFHKIMLFFIIISNTCFQQTACCLLN